VSSVWCLVSNSVFRFYEALSDVQICEIGLNPWAKNVAVSSV